MTLAGAFLAVARSGQVELVDLMTGLPAPPLTGCTGYARLAAVDVAGRPHLVTASGHAAEVRVWDLSATPPTPPTARHTDRINAVALVGTAGERLVVTGSEDGTVRRWRAIDGQPVGGPLTGHSGPVRTVACASVDGVPVAVTGGGDLNQTKDPTLRRWNLRTGRKWGPPIDTGDRGETKHLATAVVDGRAVVLSSGCDGRVALWDIATGARLAEQVDNYPPNGMVTDVVGGRPVAAITRALFDPLRVWDLTDGALLPPPERDWLYDMVRGLVAIGGVPTMVTLDSDRRLRLWAGDDAGPPTAVELPAPSTWSPSPKSAAERSRWWAATTKSYDW